MWYTTLTTESTNRHCKPLYSSIYSSVKSRRLHDWRGLYGTYRTYNTHTHTHAMACRTPGAWAVLIREQLWLVSCNFSHLCVPTYFCYGGGSFVPRAQTCAAALPSRISERAGVRQRQFRIPKDHYFKKTLSSMKTGFFFML